MGFLLSTLSTGLRATLSIDVSVTATYCIVILITLFHHRQASSWIQLILVMCLLITGLCGGISVMSVSYAELGRI